MYYLIGMFAVLVVVDIVGMIIQFKKDDKMIEEINKCTGSK